MSTDSQAGDVFSDHFASQETKSHQQPSDLGTHRRVNPHKQMLFRPTYSYLMQNIAQAFRDTSEQSVLLLYLSAPGVKILKNEEALKHGFTGGIATRGSKVHTGEKPNEFTELSQVSNCLHPADLLPFTRKPMFMVVESNNSVCFQGVPRVFNQPFLCLMSPTSYVQPNTSQVGNLFTLFLHMPILGLLSVTGVNQMDAEQWEVAKKHTEALLSILADELGNTLQDSENRKFLGDVFLRRLMAHHQFCYTVLYYHHLHSDDPAYLPTSYPEFPNSLLTLEPVCEKLRALVETLKSENQFPRLFASDIVNSQTVETSQTTQQAESTMSNVSSPDHAETMDVDSR
ncbi:hypothetical protein IWQ62_006629 [Dispira parvispora]|uniref:Uncharacterized protein n=1 Tax=Dispira parvispora TaxID=1520584 RepID=A0A9W8AI22_9FUNG|nr:hypothetical protein IWQ62_006629 [Dispira parvispora]